MRYFAELRYDGAAYCGWQRQTDAPSVQQTVEAGLSTLLRGNIEITGAGRTDTGVNAAYYVAHFDVAAPIEDCAQLVYKLNLILPHDISVWGITAVGDEAHARFDAVQREYRYRIEQTKNPFTRGGSWQYYVPLNVGEMNRAAECLLRYDDFTSFAKLNSNNKTNICRITRAEWWCEGDTLWFSIRADRFLRNMVRAVVGTLVDVGRGRYTAEDFERIVASRDLSLASGGAPAQGLFLWDVVYPDAVFERKISM